MIRPGSSERLHAGGRAASALLVALVVASAHAVAHAGPRGPLADSLEALAGGSLSQITVGVLAVSQDRGDTLLAWREADRLVPASNAKLFTTGAFLKRFGPEARWATLLLARGEASVKDGGARVRFRGDLVLRGSGIPDVEALVRPGSRGLVDSIAVLLRAGGLERFEGTLWIDGSVFAPEPYPDGWAHEDLVYSYAAPVNAVLANGNAVTLVATGLKGNVSLSLEPEGSPLVLRGSPALGAPGSAPRLAVHRDLGSRVIEVSGSIPPGGVARRPVAVPDPDSTAGLLLLGAMKRAGIETKAVVRVLPPEAGGAGKRRKDVEPFYAIPYGTSAPWSGVAWSQVRKDRAAVALALLSPSAAEVVAAVNTFSLNTEAEALLRMLDPAPRGKRTAGGLVELERILSESGIDRADILLSDGSGLSRMNVVTARSLAGWLAALDLDPQIGPPFRQGLSTPGGSGTLEGRVPKLPGNAAIRGKTGTLRNISALSGYITAESGERIVLAMVSNGAHGSVAPVRAVEDGIVNLLSRYRRDGARTAPPIGIPR